MIQSGNLKFLAVCIVAALAGSGPTTSVEIFSPHLKPPKLIEISVYHRHNRKWLTTFELKPDSSPQSVLDQLEDATYKTTTKFDRDNFKQLRNVAKLDDGCPSEHLDLVLSIYAQLTKSNETLRNFLDFYGQQKWPRCAAEVDEEIKHVPRVESVDIGREAEPLGGIDTFFCVRFGLSDELQALRHDDPPPEVYHKIDSSIYAKLKSTDRKFHLSFDECLKLSKWFGRMLDIINLARAVGDTNEHDVRLLKLNEYYRLCARRSDY